MDPLVPPEEQLWAGILTSHRDRVIRAVVLVDFEGGRAKPTKLNVTSWWI